ncbi:hypothetical protein [Comamonas thiooxydans]|uniref:hypothetical protein n=1 Tax=Comamonas thiooxydans TaxID=363952 RepID=UPI00209BC4E0|nr:hypothetical protein [Comamonas thiooxydans]MCO8250278.1 hypothetical protein [Comamonas thiooxydans]
MNRSYEVADLAQHALQGGEQQGQAPRPEASIRTRKLFVVLQSAYGTAFLAKFSTGELNERREDKGMRAAQLVWDAALAEFADDVIETASRNAQRESPEFPPSLPQFVKACEALTPRKTYFEENGLLALPAPKVERLLDVPFELKGDDKDWARKIVARINHGDQTVTRHSRMAAMEALGLNKQQEGR